MLQFTTGKKLELQSVPIKKSSQIIFQDKLFNRGPDFAKSLRDAAIGFCEGYSDPQGVCLVVEHSSYLTVWRENTQEENPVKESDRQAKAENTQLAEVEKPKPKKEVLEPEFVAFCEEVLTEYIGPIAALVCQRTFKQNPQLKPKEFVKILAKQIPNDHQATEFKKLAISKL